MREHRLSDYPSMPGWKEGETSREAAEDMALRARTLRIACFYYLLHNPYHTADEIADFLGESVLAIRPRVSELRMRGLITNDGRGINRSGKAAHKWRPTTPIYIDTGVKVMLKKSDLRSYQQRVVTHLYENDAAMAVLKMGAGKTASVLTAISELVEHKEIRHALVVAPKRVAQLVWPDEIGKWEHLKHLKYAVLDGGPDLRAYALDLSSQRQLTIIGIDNVQWLAERLEKLFAAGHPVWDCLVIDETSRLKDPKSKRGRALAKIAGRFKNRWGMTGTPTPNSLLDLYAPMKIITNGKLWGASYYKWQREHFYPLDHNGYKWRVLPGHDAVIQADAATVTIALGEDEMPDLPELNIILDEVVLPPGARDTYNDMERRMFTELDDGQDVLAVSRAVATGKLAQLSNGFIYDEAGADGAHTVHAEKAQWITELVDTLDGEPLIVVYEYKEDLAMLNRLFGSIPHLGAGVTDAQAHNQVEAWNRGELPLFALHPASGGHGLNLQSGGSRMAWIAPTWSAELWDQTIARIHRPGQKAGHVMVHVCVARNTVDQLKRLRVIEKLSAQSAFAAYLAAVRGPQAGRAAA